VQKNLGNILVQQPDHAEAHGDEKQRLHQLQDPNCDQPAITVWMGMRCQSTVVSQAGIQGDDTPLGGQACVAQLVERWCARRILNPWRFDYVTRTDSVWLPAQQGAARKSVEGCCPY
jgi:hypothetical protein